MAAGRYTKVIKLVREAEDLARSGALVFDDGAAAIFFLWGQPSHAFVAVDGGEIEGDAALKEIALSLQRPGKVSWRNRDVTRTETLRCNADDLIDILEAMARAAPPAEPRPPAPLFGKTESAPPGDPAPTEPPEPDATETDAPSADAPASAGAASVTAAPADAEPAPRRRRAETASESGQAAITAAPESEAGRAGEAPAGDGPPAAPWTEVVTNQSAPPLATWSAADRRTGEERRRGPALRYSLTDFPLLPSGPTLWADVPTSVVHLDVLIGTLRTVLVVLEAPDVRAAGVVCDGERYDAIFIDADGVKTGRVAWELMIAGQEGSVSAYEVDDVVARTLPVLWRNRVVHRDLDTTWINRGEFLAAQRGNDEDRAIIIATPEAIGIGLVAQGDPVAAYTTDTRVPAAGMDALQALLDQEGETRVSILERVPEDVGEPYRAETPDEAPLPEEEDLAEVASAFSFQPIDSAFAASPDVLANAEPAAAAAEAGWPGSPAHPQWMADLPPAELDPAGAAEPAGESEAAAGMEAASVVAAEPDAAMTSVGVAESDIAAGTDDAVEPDAGDTSDHMVDAGLGEESATAVMPEAPPATAASDTTAPSEAAQAEAAAPGSDPAAWMADGAAGWHTAEGADAPGESGALAGAPTDEPAGAVETGNGTMPHGADAHTDGDAAAASDADASNDFLFETVDESEAAADETTDDGAHDDMPLRDGVIAAPAGWSPVPTGSLPFTAPGANVGLTDFASFLTGGPSAPAEEAPPAAPAGPRIPPQRHLETEPLSTPMAVEDPGGPPDFPAIVAELVSIGTRFLGPDFAVVEPLLTAAPHTPAGLRGAISAIKRSDVPNQPPETVQSMARAMVLYVADRVTAA